MRKIIAALLAVMLCLGALCACGEQEKTESAASAQGNEASFNITAGGLTEVIKGAWVNQDDLDEKIKIGDDLSFTYFMKADRHEGKVELDEKSGMLTVTFDDSFRPVRTYIWVENKSDLNANTWYVDGGTFAFGGAVFIKDLEI